MQPWERLAPEQTRSVRDAGAESRFGDGSQNSAAPSAPGVRCRPGPGRSGGEEPSQLLVLLIQPGVEASVSPPLSFQRLTANAAAAGADGSGCEVVVNLQTDRKQESDEANVRQLQQLQQLNAAFIGASAALLQRL